MVIPVGSQNWIAFVVPFNHYRIPGKKYEKSLTLSRGGAGKGSGITWYVVMVKHRLGSVKPRRALLPGKRCESNERVPKIGFGHLLEYPFWWYKKIILKSGMFLLRRYPDF
jgi:hypothetical protein